MGTQSNKQPFAAHRNKAGMTIGQVAEKLGVSTRTVIRWEQGDTPIPLKRLEDAAAVLGVRKIDLRPDLLETAA